MEQLVLLEELWRTEIPSGDVASEDDPMASGDFTAEDIYACEQQQKALTSPYLETGPAAVGESPITNHQQAILDFMAAAEKSEA